MRSHGPLILAALLVAGCARMAPTETLAGAFGYFSGASGFRVPASMG